MSLRVIEIEADFLDEARGRARAQIDEAAIVFAEAILSEGMPQTTEGIGSTVEGASKAIEQQLPPGARIERTSVDRQPEHILMDIVADTEEAARRSIHLDKGQTLESLSLKAQGRPGFIGLGKRPPVYQAGIFQQAVVRVHFRLPVKIRWDVGTPQDCAARGHEWERQVISYREKLTVPPWGGHRCRVCLVTASHAFERVDGTRDDQRCTSCGFVMRRVKCPRCADITLQAIVLLDSRRQQDDVLNKASVCERCAKPVSYWNLRNLGLFVNAERITLQEARQYAALFPDPPPESW